MNLDEILEAVDNLPPDDLEKLKARLAEPKQPQWHSGEEWLALFDAAVEEFWAGTAAEEREAILEAINIKSKPCIEGL